MIETIYVLKYNHSSNIGDIIQSLSSKKILEDLGYNVAYIDQNELHKSTSKKITLLVNGFFCFNDNDFGTTFPFNENITPIFSNLHLELDYEKESKVSKNFFSKKNINYLKKHEPIGCRDKSTSDILKKNGIKAVNNDCITLLFKKRTKTEEENAKKLILVDVDEFIPIPKEFEGSYEYMSHNISNGDKLNNSTKLDIANDLLNYYKKNAKLIITSRFHCAMPCTAMGIPVIFLGDNNKRLQQEFVKIYSYIHFGSRHKTLFRKLKYSKYIPLLNLNIKYGFNILDLLYSLIYKITLNLGYQLNILKINWSPTVPDLEREKRNKINNLSTQLKGM